MSRPEEGWLLTQSGWMESRRLTQSANEETQDPKGPLTASCPFIHFSFPKSLDGLALTHIPSWWPAPVPHSLHSQGFLQPSLWTQAVCILPRLKDESRSPSAPA